jgi:hypothetical protein
MDHAKKISIVMNFDVDMDDCRKLTIWGGVEVGEGEESLYVESGFHQYMSVAL